MHDICYSNYTRMGSEKEVQETQNNIMGSEKEENESSFASLRNTLSVPKSKQRSIPYEQNRATDMPNVDPKKGPRYINPFDPGLDKDKLYNLSSGIPVNFELPNETLNVLPNGKRAHCQFVNSRLESTNIKFHEPIKRQKSFLFSNCGKKIEIKVNGKSKVVEANRDVLGKLLAASTKHERTIDFKKALEYPLTSVPLSLAKADGSRRMTQKSALMDVFVKKCSRDNINFRSVILAKETVLAYIIDLMALVRTFTSVPKTFEALAFKVLDCIPKTYKRVDIVAGCYTPYSIKSMEKNRRGMAPKIKVQSPKSKVPRDFKIFLANGENRTRMVELIRDVLVANRQAVFSTLWSESVVFSSFQDCIMVSRETVYQIPDLHTSPEEADTKVVLHANHVVTGSEEEELEPKWFERMMPYDIKDLFVDMEYEEFLEDSEESADEDDDE
eukprot:gene2284-2627_t